MSHSYLENSRLQRKKINEWNELQVYVESSYDWLRKLRVGCEYHDKDNWNSSCSYCFSQLG